MTESSSTAPGIKANPPTEQDDIHKPIQEITSPPTTVTPPSVPQAKGIVPEAEESLPEDAVPPNPHGDPIPVAESLSDPILPDEARVGRPEESIVEPGS